MITITLNNNNNSILNATINIPIYVHSMIPIKMTLMKLNYNIKVCNNRNVDYEFDCLL